MASGPTLDTPFEPDWRNICAIIVILLVGSLANAAGCGGGEVLVPILQVLVGFGLKDATANSQALITAGSAVSVCINMCRRQRLHDVKDVPHSKHANSPRHHHMYGPLIDVPLALAFMPALLCGVCGGVLLNAMFPSWLITAMLLALIAALLAQTFRKGLYMWRLEVGSNAAAAAAAAQHAPTGSMARAGSLSLATGVNKQHQHIINKAVVTINPTGPGHQLDMQQQQQQQQQCKDQQQCVPQHSNCQCSSCSQGANNLLQNGNAAAPCVHECISSPPTGSIVVTVAASAGAAACTAPTVGTTAHAPVALQQPPVGTYKDATVAAHTAHPYGNCLPAPQQLHGSRCSNSSASSSGGNRRCNKHNGWHRGVLHRICLGLSLLPVLPLVAMVVVWAVFVVLQVLRSLVQRCSMTYWVLLAIQLTVMVSVSALHVSYLRWQRTRATSTAASTEDNNRNFDHLAVQDACAAHGAGARHEAAHCPDPTAVQLSSWAVSSWGRLTSPLMPAGTSSSSSTTTSSTTSSSSRNGSIHGDSNANTNNNHSGSSNSEIDSPESSTTESSDTDSTWTTTSGSSSGMLPAPCRPTTQQGAHPYAADATIVVIPDSDDAQRELDQDNGSVQSADEQHISEQLASKNDEAGSDDQLDLITDPAPAVGSACGCYGGGGNGGNDVGNSALLHQDVKGEEQHKQQEHASTLGTSTLATVACLLGASCAGLLGGLLGVGGGILIGPLLLTFGVHPRVVGATSSLMVLFSSSAAAVGFGALGRLNTQFCLVLGAANALAAALGVLALARVVRRTGRSSLAVFALCGVLLLAGACVAAMGIPLIQKAAHGVHVGFTPLCSS